MTVAPHNPFTADLIDVTEALRPWWMAAEEPGPHWHLHRSGEFPTLVDPALIEKEEPE